MIISFFEEFPTKENLKKVNLIKFPSKLYFAAPSMKTFLDIKKKVSNKNIKEVVYWPTLKKQEGYWISPFSSTKALVRIFSELKTKKIPVMLDLEFPINRLHILKRIFLFHKNKKMIFDFIKSYRGKIYTAEYFYSRKGFLSPTLKNKRIKMLYCSFHHFSNKFIKETAKKAIIGLGIITEGIDHHHLILPPQRLKSELELLKKEEEVIIFRLGGLNKKYLKVIQESAF